MVSVDHFGYELRRQLREAAAAGAIGDGKTLQELSCYSTLVSDSFTPRTGMTVAGDPKFQSPSKADLSFTDSSGAFTLSAWNQDNNWCLRIKTVDKKLTSL